MVRLSTFMPKAFSRTGWRMLKEIERCGYIDVTPEGWRIARGTACMPKEVDPAHWWQRAAWCALRWYPAGVSMDHLHMLTEPSTGVGPTSVRRIWLRHDLARRHQRLLRLEAEAQKGTTARWLRSRRIPCPMTDRAHALPAVRQKLDNDSSSNVFYE